MTPICVNTTTQRTAGLTFERTVSNQQGASVSECNAVLFGANIFADADTKLAATSAENPVVDKSILLRSNAQQSISKVGSSSLPIVPSLLRGELALGYAYVVARCNSSFATDLKSQSILKSLNQVPQDVPLLARIAFHCEVSLADLVCNHSVLPFLRAFAVQEKHERPFAPASKNELRYVCNGLPRETVACCPGCVEEDISFWGRSYWRRDHQIPGIDWCQKHQVPLLQCAASYIQNEPRDALSNAIQITSAPYPESGEPILRYMDLVSYLLDRKMPIPISTLRDVVRSELKKQGLRLSRKGKRPLLSDIAAKQFPSEWLNRLLPKSKEKKPNEFLDQIDCVPTSGYPSAVSCTFAISTLFESVSDALNNLTTSDFKPQSSTFQAPKLPPGFWSSIDALMTYIRHNGNSAGIATELGISRPYAFSCLKSHGFPTEREFRSTSFANIGMTILNGGELSPLISQSIKDPADEKFFRLVTKTLWTGSGLIKTR